ncbi:MAG: bifunctional serine/threonine-protein kinase/formylglycine-generating enzyme family protein [Prevotellaceae bacterium]|nr:bifunctional serine/threonine-protein kinase/formylglycine-generating enzyme family protein [Prevotellaceae bacterium]
MQNLKVGSTLQGGRYKITGILGQGGFGITYLAIQSGLERKVAVKEFFMKELCERDETTSHVTIGTEGSRETVNRFREKFLKEARHIAKFNHPNIVRVIDVFDENATSYYVMDFVEGESLSARLKRTGKPMSEAELMLVISQILEALECVHAEGIWHLDLKPANIMIDKKGNVQLIDFGASKQLKSADGENLSTSSAMAYTAGYASSEQMEQNIEKIGAWSDLYSLGATIYNLLTMRKPPLPSDIEEDPREALKLPLGISKKTEELIFWLMKPNRKMRPQSVAEVKQFIANAQDSSSTDKKEADNKASDNKTISDNDDTIIKETEKKKKEEAQQSEKQKKKKETPAKPKIKSPFKFKRTFLWVAAIVIVAIAGVLVVNNIGKNDIFVLEEIVGDDKVFTVGDVEFVMKPVVGGTFTMGATPEQQDPYDREKPTHQVTLSSYYIGETEVTQALWTAVMGNTVEQIAEANGRETWGVGKDYPTYDISWNDCQEFISKLNSLTGQKFRLPTEAEWEYAARGGNKSKGYQYSGSNNFDDVAWYGYNSVDKTHPVKTKQPNELGIYDMSGNVSEWCQDRYGSYSSGSQTNPKGPSTGSDRVIRGGSLGSFARDCRSAYRYNCTPGDRYPDLGLRLVLSE